VVGLWDVVTRNIDSMVQALSKEPVIIMFSTGKDSIASADLFFQKYPGEKQLVFLFFVDGLEIKERVLQYYEKLWRTTILRRPSETALSLDTGKKYRRADVERGLKAELNISWLVQGIRKSESFARRGMLKNVPDGIDERNGKLYPIADWSSKDVLSYCKMRKLPLPIEYQHGLIHDFSVPDPELLLYLKNNFPGDYRKVIKTYPHLEAMVWRLTS